MMTEGRVGSLRNSRTSASFGHAFHLRPERNPAWAGLELKHFVFTAAASIMALGDPARIRRVVEL